MSETRSPGVSVPFTAGMMCHRWQAQEGIKGTARLSQRELEQVTKFVSQVQAISRQVQGAGFIVILR